jgi:hypothetical protein
MAGGRRRVLAGMLAALMLATGVAVLATGMETEARFEAAQSAHATLW